MEKLQTKVMAVNHCVSSVGCSCAAVMCLLPSHMPGVVSCGWGPVTGLRCRYASRVMSCGSGSMQERSSHDASELACLPVLLKHVYVQEMLRCSNSSKHTCSVAATTAVGKTSGDLVYATLDCMQHYMVSNPGLGAALGCQQTGLCTDANSWLTKVEHEAVAQTVEGNIS